MRALIALLLLCPAAASAQPDPGGWVAPCAPDDGEARRAREALRHFGGALEGGEPLESLRRRWETVRDEPCLAIAAETMPPPDLASLPHFRAWWDAGGRDWLYSLLSAEDALVIPPEPPAPLDLDALSPGLRALMCPRSDPSCGADTLGWRRRAEAAFEAAASEADRDCAAVIRRSSHGRRWDNWARCEASRAPAPGALPLERWRAPTRGWLVLRGRRGHYRYCEEVRAYDLSTGGAIAARSCRGLALQPGGTVDAHARPGEIVVESGRLPLDNLREAAWMLLGAETVTRRRTRLREVPAPPRLRRRFRAGLEGYMGFGRGGWSHSGQTRLAWAWVDGDRTLAEGTLTWPDSDRPGENHAAELLRVTEAGRVEGCVPAALPAISLGGGASSVSPVDGSPEARRTLEARLVERLRAARPAICATASRAGSAP